jgi:hypothetical protein
LISRSSVIVTGGSVWRRIYYEIKREHCHCDYRT